MLDLESGEVANHIIFDGNSFYHKTNPLFIEVMTGRESRTDKGKGTLRTTNAPSVENRSRPEQEIYRVEGNGVDYPDDQSLVGD